MPIFNNIFLYCDGSSRGNPGPGAIGIIICDDSDQVLFEYSECIGRCTNNQAEYQALIKGLDFSAQYTRRRVTVFSDSELIINQMNGSFRLKNDKLRELYQQVKDRERVFDEVVYQYVPRGNQRITQADRLNKRAHSGRTVKNYRVKP